MVHFYQAFRYIYQNTMISEHLPLIFMFILGHKNNLNVILKINLFLIFGFVFGFDKCNHENNCIPCILF